MADQTFQPRSPLLAVLCVLALQLAGILWLGKSTAGSILGHSCQITAVLLAASYCLDGYRSTRGAPRRFWLLITIGFLFSAFAPLGNIYYMDWLGVPVPRFSPVKLLLPLSFACFTMALVLDEENGPGRLQWTTALDFLQGALAILFLYFTLGYVPSLGLDTASALGREAAVLTASGLLLLGFALLRLNFVRSRKLRRLYWGAALYLAVITLSLAIAAYYRIYLKASDGWSYLLFTVPFLTAILLAGSYRPHPETPVAPEAARSSWGRLLITNLTLALVPLLLAEESGRLPREWTLVGIVAVVVSAVCFASRLMLDQYRMTSAAHKHHESLVLLRAVTESTTDPIFVKDMSGCYLMVNDAAARVFGSPVQDILGKKDAQLFPPSVARRMTDVDQLTMRSGETQTCEESGIAGAEGRTYLSTRCPFRDSTGRIIGLLQISRDLTEHNRAEQKFRSLVQNSSDLIMTIDAGGILRYVSPSAERVLGYGSEGLQAQNILSYIHPDDRERFRSFFARLLPRPGSCTEENYRFAHSHGLWVDLWVVGTNLLADFSVQGIVVNCRDISAQARAEKGRVEAEIRYRTLVEQLAAVTYIARLGVHARWQYVSPQIHTILGFSPSEWLANPEFWISRVHPEDLRLVEAALEDTSSAKPYRAEYRMFHRDGRVVWVNDTAAVVRSSEGDSLLHGILVDVSERKYMEMQLRQAQKMQAVGRLAGGIAHDFNNLLTVIMGYAQSLLERSNAAEDAVRRSAEHIRSAAERAAALTRQLLAFGRRQVLDPRVLNLNAVISEMDKMVRRLIPENIEIITRTAPGLGSVKTDPAQIGQVILNLVINARDAMPAGGSLAIETANVDFDQVYADEHVQVRAGRYVMLAVSDTGTGMDAETQARIFEPFFTTKDSAKGTGLGLSTVYGIIEQSGGYISVYSAPGRGSTFKVYLPRIDQPAQAIVRPMIETSSVSGSESILLVEDDRMVRELTQTILRSCGYLVHAPERVDDVESVCRHNSGRFDLLLTDVVMPGMSGKELAARVTFMCPHMKVLYMSGHTDDAIVHQGLLDPGIWFLPKPFTPATLAAKVREVLDHPGKAA